MLYCRKCKLIFLESSSEQCSCGRKLNCTNDDYMKAYMERGYTLVQSDNRSKSDRQKELETIRKDILHSMGAESYEELFDPNHIIDAYIQKEAERQEDIEKERKSKKEDRRRKFEQKRLEIKRQGNNLKDVNVSDDTFDVVQFLDLLGLQKKKI